MPIRTDLHTQELIAQFRAQRQAAQKPKSDSSRPAQASATAADSFSIHSNVQLEATVSASGAGSTDKVDIALTGNMTVAAANGILEDSVIDQITQAFKEAGIDLTIEESGESTTPEATAGRIVDFATGFLEAFRENHSAEAPKAKIEGFMSLIRDAISEGFQQARDFLNGIAKLSDTVDENISKTFEVTNNLLDAFHQAQVDNLAATAAAGSVEVVETSESDDSSQAAAGANGAVPEGTEDGSTQLTEGLV